MKTITATRAFAPTTPAADGMARIAGLPSSVVPRASVAASSVAVPAGRLEIEFARKSLEQALKRTYVPAPAPGSLGRGLARYGPLALGLLAWTFLTSGGERNLAVLVGKLPNYVSEAELQMASQVVGGSDSNAQKNRAGLDTSDKLGQFIVGAAALGWLHRDGKITGPMLTQALSRLKANIVAGRPASQGIFDAPPRSVPLNNPTRPRDTGTQAHSNRVPQTTDAPPRPVPRVSPLPTVEPNRPVPNVSPLPTVPKPGRKDGTANRSPDGAVDPNVKTRSSGSTRKPDLPDIPKDFDHTEAGLTKLLKSAGSRTLQQRVENYRSGRTTREQATQGLDDAAKTRMNTWLDAIDRSRMTAGGATGGRSVTAGVSSDATKSDFPAVKASKNVYPDGQANVKNKIVKSLTGATSGAIQRGQAVQLANLIGDKYKNEADALKIATITGELLKAGHSVERVAYALASSVKNADAFRHLGGGANIENKTQADNFIARFVKIKDLPKDQRASALTDLISGNSLKRAVEPKKQDAVGNTAASPAQTKLPTPPALDTSNWNLPMGEAGETFFGKLPIPTKYLPQSNPSQSTPATPAGRGKAKSFKELEASLLGGETEERSVAFIGNNFGKTARTPNEQFAINLFKDQKSIASHFLKRPLADRPGQSPTAFSYGGHAVEGLFANITGKTYTEIAKKILVRVDELVKAGVLVKIGAGASNGVYLHKPTQQVVRIGRISSNELQATAGFSKIGDKGVGAKIDLSRSLYLPSELISAAKTEGFAVLFMERVPGMRLQGNGYLLSSSAKEKIASAVADALVTMHMNNKTHGDFGTHNVNVTVNGEVRIIDFDLAGSTRSNWNVSNDLDGMTSVLLELYPSSRSYSKEQVRAVVLNLYLKAVDRLVGPDRKSDLYKKHPELYESHVARFNAKKDALKQNAAAAFK